MTENTEDRQRPNANYKLSRERPHPMDEEKLTFYYNRQHRLDKAPRSVNKLYEEPKQKSFNLIRPLIADKPRATIFFTIIVLCVVIIMLGLLGFMNKGYTLDGNMLEISGTRFEGATIIVIKKTVKKNNTAYTGTVDIGISPVMEGDEFPIFLQRIFFTLQQEEETRFVVPYEAQELALVFQLENEKTPLKIKLKVD